VPELSTTRLLERPKITAPDATRVGTITTFLCAGTFCARFRHAVIRRAARAAIAGLGFHSSQNNAVRNLSQALSITFVNKARASLSVARAPFASPYCPRLAQIRRLHVQPRTGLAVHPSMRVRESCLTFSPRASP
jgi:hypothetical protein